MNLVIGATGLVGSEVCRLLREEGKPVRALVRSTSHPARVEQIKNLGVETVSGDLKDPATLRAACRGVKALISTASSTTSRQAGDTLQTVDEQGQSSLIEAARTAGVEHEVFVSFRFKSEAESPLQSAKRAVEERLRASGLLYTILKASYFMEVWLSPALGFDIANAKATIYGSGQSKISWISNADVARFCVAALDRPAARNAVIAVGGPEALSLLEVVRTCEELGGRKFDLTYVSEETLRARKEQVKDPMEQTFAALMLSAALGDAIDMRETLKTYPLRLTTVHDYAKRLLGKES